MEKDLIYTSIIIGIGLAYMHWDTPISGFWNTILAIAIAYILQKLFLWILAFIGYRKYGIIFEIEKYSIKKEKKVFSLLKKGYTKKEIVINWLGYLLSILSIVLTAGLILPINTYIIKFKEHLTARVGKVKPSDIQVKHIEKIDLLLLTSTIYLIIISIIILLLDNFSLIPLKEYLIHFSIFYVLSRFIPWNYILSPLVLYYLKFEFINSTEGDSLLALKKEQQLIRIVYLITMLFTFTFLPVIFPIIAFIVAIIVWLKYQYEHLA